MNEEDIKRIEKKVDLLYEIILRLNVDDNNHINNEEVINYVIDDLIPLFNLSTEKEAIEIQNQEEIWELIRKCKGELEQLEKDYEKGNFLAKEEGKIKKKIKELTNDLEVLASISKSHRGLKKLNKKLYELLLFHDLRKRIGIKRYSKVLRTNDYLTKFCDLADLKKSLSDNLKKKLSKKGIELKTFFDIDQGNRLYFTFK